MASDDFKHGTYHLEQRHFDDNHVRRARNPHPSYGYFHGPIPTHNSSFWKTFDNHGPAAATFHAIVSQIHPLVCDVDLGPGGMCGQVFAHSRGFRHHLKAKHRNDGIRHGNIKELTKDEIVSGQNALKYWVLSGGWYKAHYKSEPGRGPIGGFLDIFATACERIAHSNASFAERWGRDFHRPLRDKPANGPRYYERTYIPPPALELGPPIRKIHQATYNGPPGLSSNVQNTSTLGTTRVSTRSAAEKAPSKPSRISARKPAPQPPVEGNLKPTSWSSLLQ